MEHLRFEDTKRIVTRKGFGSFEKRAPAHDSIQLSLYICMCTRRLTNGLFMVYDKCLLHCFQEVDHVKRTHVKGVFAWKMIMNRTVSDALIALLPILVDYVNVSTNIIRMSTYASLLNLVQAIDPFVWNTYINIILVDTYICNKR